MFRLWAVLVLLIAVNEQMVQGSTCYKEDGRAGICMELEECEVSSRAFDECRLKPDVCEAGFQSLKACCPKRPMVIKERPIDYSCNTNTYRRRVIGEAVNNRTLYPHAAALGYAAPYSKRYLWNCGGTLIHRRYVLTAAHCIKRERPKVVLLGAFDLLATNDPYRQIRKVDFVIPHEEYKQNKYKRHNDIGLVRLKEAIEETAYVNPACLLTSGRGRIGEVTTIGWGVGSNDGAQVTNEMKILREARMGVIQCSGKDEVGTHKDYIICAKGKTDAACQGDSGGPLQVYFRETGRLYVMGVHSYGANRCTSDVAARFISLIPFLDWIEKKVWTAEHCVHKKKLKQ